MKRIFCALVLLALSSGCYSIDSMARNNLQFVNYVKTNYNAQPGDYPVDLFFEGKPARDYAVIGEIMGYADHGDLVRPMLEARARQLGADAVIDIAAKAATRKDSEIINVSETSGRRHNRIIPIEKTYYYDVINITAKMIRYKD